MNNKNYLLKYSYNHKARVIQLDLIEVFLPANVKHGNFGSWIVDMENTSQSMPTILEDHLYWRSQYMEWLIMESYFLIKPPIG